MIFKQVDEIVNGTKTQTRRVVNESEWQMQNTVYSGRRVKWQVGRAYAVVPKMGKPAVFWNGNASDPQWKTGRPVDYGMRAWKPLRITITAIRQERLRDISEADAIAEGVSSVAEYRALWERINGDGSWQLNPLVWVLEFEVAK